MTATSTDKRTFDFSKFDEDALDHWSEIYNDNLTYPQNLIELTEKFIAYPDKERQILLFVAYTLMPTALAKVSPIMIVNGIPGSGKSMTGLWASKIRGMPIFSSGDTAASLRNSIEAMRYRNEVEQNILLIWDDIDPFVLINKPDIYRMLKYGYNRATDAVSIASAKAGKNIKFRTFSTKIASTIHPIYAMNEFIELSRRCIVLKTQKAEILGVKELFDFQIINWKGFSNFYDDFWKDELTCTTYISQRKTLARKKPLAIPSDKWVLSLDLMATMMTTNLFESQKNCIEFMADYWSWHDKLCSQENGSLKGLLQSYIDDSKEKHDVIVTNSGIQIPFIIQPSMIKQKVDSWTKDGALETKVDPRILLEVMGILGFKLTPKGWEERHDV